MYDMPEREETQETPKKEPKATQRATPEPLGTRCRLCERYPGGPATGWHSITHTRMCATGRAKPDHQASATLESSTHCTCALGRWLASSAEAQKVAARLASDGRRDRNERGVA